MYIFNAAYSTRDVSTTSGADYQPVIGETVTFAADSDIAVANVNIIPDKSTEDPEVFEVSIASPSIGELGAVTKATVTLYDALSSREYIHKTRTIRVIRKCDALLSKMPNTQVHHAK